jgi:stage V sporulation protein R
MEIINQRTKTIMEGCKQRARAAGLRFQDESLEYIVTNRDLLELSPKMMIPTLYDYWVHDVEVLKEKGKYELYPGNPYETVINTRPAISFYNDNNPDWLNVMIFYHVLAHIDFFQNNSFFRHTWDYDFTGQALSDKRTIDRLRNEKGRWVDYAIEFCRSIDNMVGYHDELGHRNHSDRPSLSPRLDYYFDVFLQAVLHVKIGEYVREVERYNECLALHKDLAEKIFFADVERSHPEFEAVYQKFREAKPLRRKDLIEYLMDHSLFLNKEENHWIKTVMQVVRQTSLFFQPQIRTKIMNEGWASYWHEALFLQDERIKGHEVDYARINAGVTAMPRIGLNPYGLGMRLFAAIEEKADKGRYSVAFERISDAHQRRTYDASTGGGRDFIFSVRENFCDSMFIGTFLDQDFVDRHQLFVVGRRLNKDRQVWEYYIKSRRAEDYRSMVSDSLHHPPHITVQQAKARGGGLYLNHHFEGKPLVKEYIAPTLMGIEYLWGGPVELETSEVAAAMTPAERGPLAAMWAAKFEGQERQELRWERVVYTMDQRKLSRRVI